MDSMLGNPTFVLYALTCVVLALNLMFVWAYSAVARAKTKTAVNAEDAAQFKTALVDEDPPEVRRVLRAHANAQANIVPFLLLGLVFVLAGGGATFAKIVFGTFVVARLVHSVVYIAGKQPWRTIFFSIGALAAGALAVDIVVLVASK